MLRLTAIDHVGLTAADGAAGIDHFGFSVEAASIDEVMADLRAAGHVIVRGPVERRDATALFLKRAAG